jgi:hypothetical protein
VLLRTKQCSACVQEISRLKKGGLSSSVTALFHLLHVLDQYFVLVLT